MARRTSDQSRWPQRGVLSDFELAYTCDLCVNDLGLGHACQCKVYKVHKSVLARDSRLYHKLFSSHAGVEWNEVALGRYSVSDIDANAVPLLIDFFYTGAYQIRDDPDLDERKDRHRKYILHGEMVIAAEKYEIAALASLAATNFRRTSYDVGDFQAKAPSLAHTIANTSYYASKKFYDTMAEAWSFWRSPGTEAEFVDEEGDVVHGSADGQDDDDDDADERAFLVGNPEFAACLALKVNCDYLRCSSCRKGTKLLGDLPDSDICGFCGTKELNRFGAWRAKMSTIWADMYAIGQVVERDADRSSDNYDSS